MSTRKHAPLPPRTGPSGGVALVSVVIPCHNYGRFLADAIASVRGQTHRRHEIIVVDDGSTDGSAAVCARFPEVRLIQQPQSGVSNARNRGIAESRGEFVVFLDADDLLLPNALAVGIDELVKHPGYAFTSGRYTLIGPRGEPSGEPGRWHIEEPHYHALLRRNYIGPPCTIMFRRGPLEASGGFDTTLKYVVEDYDLSLRIAAAHPIGSHDTLVACYRVHGENASRRPARQLEGTLRLLARHADRVRDDPAAIEACREGVRNARAYYCGVLLEIAVRDLRGGHYLAVSRALPTLLRHGRRTLARRVATAAWRRLPGRRRRMDAAGGAATDSAGAIPRSGNTSWGIENDRT